MNHQIINHRAIFKKGYSLAIFFVLSLFIASLNAQSANTTNFAVYPGFGIGFGFFYPKDVNNYIENDLPTLDYQIGFSEIIMYFEGHASLTFKIKWIDITTLIEYAIAPKYISVTGSSEGDYFYTFGRFSPGILTNFYFPIGSGKHALYAGGGVQYHFMKFEEYKGKNIGFRLNAGISLQFKKFNLQPFLAFNIANAKDEEIESFDLNYTGGQIGVNLSFHRPVAYK
jgi:hypothetical protein